MRVAFFDTRSYDREAFAPFHLPGIEWQFQEPRLSSATAPLVENCQAVCLFVNDIADRACLEKLAARGVRHVAMRCAGYNNLDVDAARAIGITATRVPAYSPHAVAEHAIALLLTLNRKIHRAHNRVRELNFSLAGLVGFDLYGKTAGLLGTGKIGRVTGEIFRGFGMRVVAFDVYPDHAWAKAHGIEYLPLADLLPRVDVLSLHTPLTPETHHLINDQTLAAMKPGAYLINTSRGQLIDTAALIKALKSGTLGGVALDVYEEEAGVFYEDLSSRGLQDDELSRLLTFPNVLITAHQAFLTREALHEIAAVTTDNLCRLKEGRAFAPGTQLV